MPPLSPQLASWMDRGRFLEVDGRKIFVVTAGDEKSMPLLILHGFPTFSYDFSRVLPALSKRYRVVLHDHPGFGFSDKPEHYSYSLVEQAETAIGLWRALGITRGHLLAHDYGTSVATEILARRRTGALPVEPASLTLCNGSVHIELARLTLSQRIMRDPRMGPVFVRLSSRAFFRSRIRKILGDPASVPADELDLLWEGVNHNNGRLRLPRISQYLRERVIFRHRWIGALQALDLPTHVLWGRKDPIAVEAIARRLAEEIPGARLTWLDEAGHYPMLEAPDAWAGAVLGFLDTLGAGEETSGARRSRAEGL